MAEPKLVISVSIKCGTTVDTESFADDNRHGKHRDVLNYIVGVLMADNPDLERMGSTLRRLAGTADRLASMSLTPKDPPVKPTPLLHADGSRHDCMPRVNGVPFRCPCGTNVFHTPDATKLWILACNACGTEYSSDPTLD
jgi:hypothetical protein